MPHSDGWALFWRALAAFLALPAVVGFVVPWLMRPVGRQPWAPGVVVAAAGTTLLLWCVRDFYVAGRGTLAPWSPPRYLVTVGLYRVSRNPMYISVLTILCGWSLAFRSVRLWEYAAGVAIAFHLRVVLSEEPFLARAHGAEWTAYRGRVRQWFGWRRTRDGTA
jgi:protein-S-isoprenylcysteine O-methyltransferase Ste14